MHASIPILHVSFFLSDFWIFPFFFFFLLCFLFFLSTPIFCHCFSSPFFPHFSLFTPMAFYTVYRDKIYHFYPSTAFGLLWASFQDCPLVCWMLNHYHYTLLATPCLIPRQKRFLFCLLPLYIFNTLIQIRVKLLPYLPLWHASTDSSLCLLLLGEISFQQDISPQKSLSKNPKIGSPISPLPGHTFSYF